MRKVLCTSLALLLILSGISAAFAAEANKAAAAATTSAVTSATASAVTATSTAIDTTTTTSTAIDTTGAAVTVIVPTMTFTGTPITLSLDAAYKKMLADSSGAKMADLNKLKAEGIANGHGESVRLVNKAEDADKSVTDPAISMSINYSTTNKDILRLQQEYAKTQADKNYQAEINKLKNDTLNNYYTLKELENQVQIAKDNQALSEKLLSNTQLKFKLGTVSKSDVLKAETSMYEAKDKLLAAQDGLDKMKMGFNQFIGYSLMQNVSLTDNITEVALPTKTLAASIKDALLNRNEISEATFNLKASTLNLQTLQAYPARSSKKIQAQMSMLMAETANKNAPLTVESDVRTKYMTMNEKYSAVQTGKKAVENAKETERLTRLQYDAGMATLTDVESAQLGLYNEQLDYSKTLLAYNLAVNDYILSSTVGADTASIE